MKWRGRKRKERNMKWNELKGNRKDMNGNDMKWRDMKGQERNWKKREGIERKKKWKERNWKDMNGNKRKWKEMEEQGNPSNSECSKCASHQLGEKVQLRKNLWASNKNAISQAHRFSVTAHKNITYNKGYRKDTKGPEGKWAQEKKRTWKENERTWMEMNGNKWTWKEMKGTEIKGNERKWKEMEGNDNSQRQGNPRISECSKCASHQLGEKVRL